MRTPVEAAAFITDDPASQRYIASQYERNADAYRFTNGLLPEDHVHFVYAGACLLCDKSFLEDQDECQFCGKAEIVCQCPIFAPIPREFIYVRYHRPHTRMQRVGELIRDLLGGRYAA